MVQNKRFGTVHPQRLVQSRSSRNLAQLSHVKSVLPYAAMKLPIFIVGPLQVQRLSGSTFLKSKCYLLRELQKKTLTASFDHHSYGSESFADNHVAHQERTSVGS